MTVLQGKRILLVIGGGIAAYKTLELIRELRKRGAAVTCVVTSAAQQFVTPLSIAALSGEKVYSDLFSLTDETEMGHIELSRSADLVAVVPATADLLAKMAQGHADDLASTLLLATDKRVLAAPAMNVRMWLHQATQRNVGTLRSDGVSFAGPANGEMACGEFGPGRMAEPAEIIAELEKLLAGDTMLLLPGRAASAELGTAPALLAGKRVVVTSGPTHEPIDPVRYIANRSSGQQGHAIAAAAVAAGADVTLVSGPVSLPVPTGVKLAAVETAAEMLAAVEAAMPADVFIAAAAVADWRVETAHREKVKKTASAGPPALKLVENPDILKTIASKKSGRPAVVVGFAAETNSLLANASAKLASKGCDMIVANDVSPGTGVMGGRRNTVHILTTDGIENWPEMDKNEVAAKLISAIANRLRSGSKT